MGIVYRAHDRVLGRDVALKVLHAPGAARRTSAARLHREARVLAALEHPGIVPVHDVGVLDGRPFYVMKLVRGRRLDEWAAGGPALADRLRAFERICEAVAFAHAHGVVHRDLKPANVMLGAFGEVLVMDWGVAKVLGDAGVGRRGRARGGGDRGGDRPRDARLHGPRAGRGRPTVDARTDVHALGAILHFLLAGGPPGEAALPARHAARRCPPSSGAARRRARTRATVGHWPLPPTCAPSSRGTRSPPTRRACWEGRPGGLALPCADRARADVHDHAGGLDLWASIVDANGRAAGRVMEGRTWRQI